MEENKKKALLLQQKQLNIPAAQLQQPQKQTDSSTGNSGKCVPLEDDPENRFEIITGYNKDLIDLFKTFSSRKYDPNTKRWVIFLLFFF
jgi:hypothetical protein